MKGVILHGGSGTRLRPLTYTDVKQLLPVAGKPISEYALENLMEIGIKDVNIIIGSLGGEEVKKYYGDGSRWGVNITYTYQDKPSGIAHAIGLTKNFVKNDKFVVFLGDNYIQEGISELFKSFVSQNCDGMLALTHVSNPSQFGIAEVKDGKIVKLVEKPKIPASDLAIAGVYFLSSKVFDFIEKLKPSGRGEYEITEAYQNMVDSKLNIGYSIISGWFKDTGTVEDFLDCNRLVLDKLIIKTDKNELRKNISGRVNIAEGAHISENSRILGPCFIGPGTSIENSYIGPFTSIGSNCKISNSEIEDTIVMDGVEIDMSSNFRLRGSLIGPNVKIKTDGKSSNPMKVVLGRDSKLEF